MDYLAINIGEREIAPPGGVPTGGIAVVGTIIGNALNLIIILVIIVTLISLVWAGIQWTSSNGDKGKITAARGRITWSLVGLILALSIFFILNIIGYLFNVDLLNFNIN